MIFTDEDLKRLKDHLYDDGSSGSMRDFNLRALIIRLEAAERCAELIGTVGADSFKAVELARKWHKATGSE